MRQRLDTGRSFRQRRGGAGLQPPDSVVQGLRAACETFRVKFIEQGKPGGQKQPLWPDIAKRVDQSPDTSIEAGAELFQARFLAGRAAQRVAFSGNGEFRLGQFARPSVSPTLLFTLETQAILHLPERLANLAYRRAERFGSFVGKLLQFPLARARCVEIACQARPVHAQRFGLAGVWSMRFEPFEQALQPSLQAPDGVREPLRGGVHLVLRRRGVRHIDHNLRRL